MQARGGPSMQAARHDASPERVTNCALKDFIMRAHHGSEPRARCVLIDWMASLVEPLYQAFWLT